MPLRLEKYILILLSFILIRTVGAAQEVVVVLSSELDPYLQAYDGFKETFGNPVPVVSLSAGRPEIGLNTRVVVAFGGKAAVEKYPSEVALVYCMSPGTDLSGLERRGPTVRINMLPRGREVVESLKSIQPLMKRLVVFWVLDVTKSYYQSMVKVGNDLEVDILAERLDHADDLPDKLRALMGKNVDALWLPPDPLLINPHSFSVIKEFSWANDMPLYGPTAGFVEAGAVAAVSVSFRHIGQIAADMVSNILEGGQPSGNVYPRESQITVNQQAASKVGLQIPAEVMHQAFKVQR